MTDFQSIPLPTKENYQLVLQRVKLILDDMIGAGRNKGRRVITIDDLGGDEVVDILSGAGIAGVGDGYDPTTDTTTPPPPANLVVQGGYGTIILKWDAPPVTYRNPAYAEVYASSTNNLGAAVLVGKSTSNTFVDRPGANVTKYYWIRFVSQANVAGPYNTAAGAGTVGNTAIDVTAVLTELTNKVTESQLYKDLGTTIKTFEPYVTYDFNGGTDGWTFSSITTTTGANAIVLDSGGTDPQAISPAVSIDGSRYDKVRARVKRNSGATFDGTIYYVTAGHAFDAGYRKQIADTTIVGEWVELEWDMAALTAGGTDWVTSTITQIRIDLGTSAADDFTVDWVSIGRRAAGVSSARMGNAEVAISTETSVRAAETGYIAGTYSVRTSVTQDGKTIAGGFGLTGTSGGTAGPTIDFGVLANKFWIGAPTGSGSGISSVMPFMVQTTDTTEGGVFVPKGVYMDAAYIINLTAKYAVIQSLVADDISAANLSASQLTVGDGTIGGQLKSSNYSAGSAGWILQPNGSLELNQLVARGTIYASAGSIGGITIGLHDLRSTNYVPGSTGFRINDDGSLEANNIYARGNIQATSLNAATGTFAGSLSAATGTFAGSLSAASGTFSGTLTATAINAVQTINMAGGSVTNTIATSVAGTLKNTVSGVTSRTSTKTLGSITTSAYGDGRVVLWIGSNPLQGPIEWSLYNYISSISVTRDGSGDGGVRWRVYRNGTMIYEAAYAWTTGSGTTNLFDTTSLVFDAPGPGVTATYTYELYSYSDNATNHAHGILPMNTVLMEQRR